MLSRTNRLTKRGSFAYVYRKGLKSSAPNLKMFFVRSSGIKIGFSVSNKMGKAVVRNKIKRRLRAAVREAMPLVVTGCQVVFLAKDGIGQADYKTIKSEVFLLLSGSKLLKNP